MENNFNPRNEYNKNLFDLYLTYIKRYRLSYSVKNQARTLVTVLENEKISIIKSWFDLYCLSDAYGLYQPNSPAKGCAFIKIGKVLQELGVLPPREDELDRQIMLQLSYFSHPKNVEMFSQSLMKVGNSKETIIKYLCALRYFSHWLFHIKNKESLELVSSNDIKTYIQLLKEQHPNQYIRSRYHYLSRYYKWLLFKGFIEVDPTPNLELNREKGKINILDDHKIKKLFSFIRNPSSSPEQSLMIALCLIWGAKTIDLAQAQIIIKDCGFDIKFRRKTLTKGKIYYNRPEILKLPTENRWFLDLQKRYLKFWLAHYGKIKKTYPKAPLFLHRTFNSNNFLCTAVIKDRFKDATMAATDTKITNRIIRQTCGHLNSQSGDASLLSTLGWSDQFAFHYTWLPREIWSE
ncbi:MAG: site-specific integrase [Candidatus Brocadiales bacterium]|nr:site-specific integrase [Candidatus Brocadiales bacterium]